MSSRSMRGLCANNTTPKCLDDVHRQLYDTVRRLSDALRRLMMLTGGSIVFTDYGRAMCERCMCEEALAMFSGFKDLKAEKMTLPIHLFFNNAQQLKQ